MKNQSLLCLLFHSAFKLFINLICTAIQEEKNELMLKKGSTLISFLSSGIERFD